MLRVSLHLQKTGTSSWQHSFSDWWSLEKKQVAENIQLYPPEESELCSQIGKFYFLQTIN